MALSDPQTITLDGNDIVLPRTGIGPTSSTYSVDTGTNGVKLTVSHNRGKRSRHSVRLDTATTVADPLFPSVNVPKSASVYLVCDVPLNGIPMSSIVDGVQALCEFLTDSSNAVITKVLGGES
jgi:hypothetical protein